MDGQTFDKESNVSQAKLMNNFCGWMAG